MVRALLIWSVWLPASGPPVRPPEPRAGKKADLRVKSGRPCERRAVPFWPVNWSLLAEVAAEAAARAAARAAAPPPSPFCQSLSRAAHCRIPILFASP